jgi:peroxiredoxin
MSSERQKQRCRQENVEHTQTSRVHSLLRSIRATFIINDIQIEKHIYGRNAGTNASPLHT